MTHREPTLVGMSTPTPRRTRRWIEDWRPEDADFWEARRPRGRPPQPGVVDLRRARRLLGLADLERLVGVPARAGLRVHPAAAVPARRAPQPRRLAAAAALHVRGAEVRRAQLDDRQRRDAAGADAAVRVRRPGPDDALLGVLPDRRDRGRRRRQLRLVDGQHQLLLPLRQEGRGARAQRGRRQPRGLADPAAAPRHGRQAPASSASSRRRAAASTSSGRRTPMRAWRCSRRPPRGSGWTTSPP